MEPEGAIGPTGHTYKSVKVISSGMVRLAAASFLAKKEIWGNMHQLRCPYCNTGVTLFTSIEDGIIEISAAVPRLNLEHIKVADYQPEG